MRKKFVAANEKEEEEKMEGERASCERGRETGDE